MTGQTWYDLTSLCKDQPVGKSKPKPKPAPKQDLDRIAFLRQYGLA
jgi:hypothetical protein